MPSRDLTDDEAKAVRSLERLAKKWPDTLQLFSWSGTLHVMLTEDVHECFLADGGYQDASITTIPGIRNDGGDPNA